MAIYHFYDLGAITWALLRGYAQLALDLIPLVSPWPEHGNPPTWWWLASGWGDWYSHRDRNDIPDRTFIESWMRSAWRALGLWIEEVGKWALDQAGDRVRGWIGYVQYGYSNFSQWIQSTYIRLGSGMVWWASTAVEGLGKLYGWLPPEIRMGLQSWAALWDSIVGRAKAWVQATYNLAISLGAQAFGWTVQVGNRLDGWYQAAHGVLDDFRANPSAFILARLGPTWTVLQAFATIAVPFYVKLWSDHARDLADFLADPAGWIYGKLESYLERRW